MGVQGYAEKEVKGVEVDEEQKCLGEAESTFISAGVKHRLFNPGVEPLAIIEVQLGEYALVIG